MFYNFICAFSILAAIHLFISSHDEIKDFCSMDKKLVAATDGVQKLKAINGYTCVFIYTPGVVML